MPGSFDFMNNHTNTSELSEIFGEVIYSYTRAQALEDGELVDVSDTAREAGFRFPFAVTCALWNVVETIPSHTPWQDWKGRLWDCIWMARDAIRRAKPGTSRAVFQLILSSQGTRGKYQTLVIDLGPGDAAEPVFTLGFPEDF